MSQTAINEHTPPTENQPDKPKVEAFGWEGLGKPLSTNAEQEKAPHHPTIVNIGQAIGQPAFAMIEWSVETPDGSASGFFTLNMAIPTMVRMSTTEGESLVTVLTKEETIAKIRATSTASRELYTMLWDKLGPARIMYLKTVRATQRQVSLGANATTSPQSVPQGASEQQAPRQPTQKAPAAAAPSAPRPSLAPASNEIPTPGGTNKSIMIMSIIAIIVLAAAVVVLASVFMATRQPQTQAVTNASSQPQLAQPRASMQNAGSGDSYKPNESGAWQPN